MYLALRQNISSLEESVIDHLSLMELGTLQDKALSPVTCEKVGREHSGYCCGID